MGFTTKTKLARKSEPSRLGRTDAQPFPLYCFSAFLFHVSPPIGSALERRGDLRVSVLDSRSSGPSSSPGRGDIALCSWAGEFTLTVPLSTQVYKWIPANLTLGVT